MLTATGRDRASLGALPLPSYRETERIVKLSRFERAVIGLPREAFMAFLVAAILAQQIIWLPRRLWYWAIGRRLAWRRGIIKPQPWWDWREDPYPE